MFLYPKDLIVGDILYHGTKQTYVVYGTGVFCGSKEVNEKSRIKNCSLCNGKIVDEDSFAAICLGWGDSKTDARFWYNSVERPSSITKELDALIDEP